MKNLRIGLLAGLAFWASLSVAVADLSPVSIHKIRLFMKDGTRTFGYVFWEQEIGETLPFTPEKFLEHWANHPYVTKFTFIRTAYPIHDNGWLDGIAHLKEDEEEVDATEVARIESMQDPLEGRKILCGFPGLTRDEIKVMQNPLLLTDSVDCNDTDLCAFCYDPKITKRQLHRLLLKCSDSWKKGENGNFKNKPSGVVFSVSGCSD